MENNNNFDIRKSGEKYGLVDRRGNTILPTTYFGISWAQYNSLYIVKKAVGNSYSWTQSINLQHFTVGLYDAQQKKWIQECINYSIWPFDPVYHLACVVKRHDRHSSGFINAKGDFIIPLKYNMPYWEHFDAYGHMPLVYNEKWGLVDFQGNTLIDFEYDEINPIYGNCCFAKIKKNDKIGYVNTECKIIVSPRYEEGIDYFCAGGYWRTIVKEGGQYFVIDERGKHVSIGYKDIRIRIGESYYAEALCFSLFGGGWHWVRLSTITGNIVSGTGMDRTTKDLIVKAAIFGTATAASAAVSALEKAGGVSLPPPVKYKYSSEAKQRAWETYQRTDSVIDALSALLG